MQRGMVLDVVRIPRPHPSVKPGVKVDARSERWREHRKKVRGEIVDAAFRAIDRLGPELSVREIAEEAGTAKPKIYRHFRDKSDLFQAIGERLRDMLWAAIFPSIDLKTDSAREVIRRSVEEYVTLVDKHPNVLRVFIQGRSAAYPAVDRPDPQRRPRDHAWPWPTCSTTSCARWSLTTRRSNSPRTRPSDRRRRPPSGGWVPNPTARGACRASSSSRI